MATPLPAVYALVPYTTIDRSTLDSYPQVVGEFGVAQHAENNRINSAVLLKNGFGLVLAFVTLTNELSESARTAINKIILICI